MNDGLYEWLAPQNRIQHSLHFAIVQLSFCRLFCIDYQIRWADGVTSGVWRTWRSFLHCSGSKGRLTVREHCDTLMFRLKLGLTQEQVGLSVGEYCGTFLSQTTISRWLSSVLLLLMLTQECDHVMQVWVAQPLLQEHAQAHQDLLWLAAGSS